VSVNFVLGVGVDKRTEARRDLAGRMAAWFFVGLGGALLAVSAALSVMPSMWAWPIGGLGVFALAFALFASPETRTSAVEALLALLYL
jgi:hypothetical protein